MLKRRRILLWSGGGGVAPAAPSSLAATSISDTQIDLSWVDNSGNETSFSLERGTDGVVFGTVISIAADATSYSDTGLTANTQYYYRIRAKAGSIYSDYSNIANNYTYLTSSQTYFTANSITDQTEKDATNTFIRTINAASFLAKFDRLHLFSPTSSSAALADFFGGTAMTTVGSPTWATTGYTTNGSSQYITTNYVPNSSSLLASNNFCYFVYLRSSTPSASRYALGATGNIGARPTYLKGDTSAYDFNPGNGLSIATGTPAAVNGMIQGTTGATTDTRLLRNGVELNLNSTGSSHARVAVQLFLMAHNNNGTVTAGSYLAGEICFFGAATNFSSADSATFYTALQTLQTNIIGGGRQV